MSCLADLEYIRLRLNAAWHAIERDDRETLSIALDQASERMTMAMERTENPRVLLPIQTRMASAIRTLDADLRFARERIDSAREHVARLISHD